MSLLAICSTMPSRVNADIEELNVVETALIQVSGGRPRGLFHPVGGLLIAA